MSRAAMAPSSTSVRSALALDRLNGSYRGTKGHLLKLSLRLQQEAAGKGVRVQVVLPGATRTAIWEKAGTDIASLPPNIVMDVDEMVDAALVRVDRGEGGTVPSLGASRCLPYLITFVITSSAPSEAIHVLLQPRESSLKAHLRTSLDRYSTKQGFNSPRIQVACYQ